MMQYVILAILIIYRTNECAKGQVIQDELSISDSNNVSKIPAAFCVIDQLPKHGWVENTVPPFRKLTTDDYVNSLKSVTYKCEDNHFIDGPSFNTCFNGKWITAVPDCKPYCSAKNITSASFVPSMCFHNDRNIECSDPALHGTTANINCREIYHLDSDENMQVTTCGVDGVWQPPPKECSITCGVVEQNITKAPWDVTFGHDGWNTSGTIIKPRMVLSVAHVFWSLTQQKTIDLSESYVVISRENDIFQLIEIKRIAYATNHQKLLENPISGNIAVIALRTSIEFSSSVAPVCLPFDLYADGVNSNSFEGRTPQQDSIELHPPAYCYTELNSTDKRLSAIDLLCTKQLNLSSDEIRVGSSFAVPIEKNGSEVFFLFGVRTWYYQHGDQVIFDFQNVLLYKEFIQKEISNENDEKSFKVENSTITASFVDDLGYRTLPSSDEYSNSCGIVTQNVTTTPWNARVQCIPKDTYVLGTIINPRMVLSVAKHFWNSIKQQKPNLSEFYVEIERDNIIYQQIEIERIAFAPNHKKYLQFPPSGNIVLVVLRTNIEFKSYVTPICFPFELNDDVVTRSSFEGRTPQQKNVHLQIPTNCYKKWNSTDQKPVLANDVLCTDGLKLTTNDIFFGSSFAIPIETNGSEVFYLLGIHTWNTSPAGMNQGTYFQFQNVLFYKEFIQKEVSYENGKDSEISDPTISSIFVDKTSYCRTDNIPNRGSAYYASNDQKIEFGELIPNSASIIYRCIENHVLYGNSTNLCENGKWMFSKPECKPRCNPKEIQGWTLVANCQLIENNTIRNVTSCNEPGTVAYIKCKSGYERFGSYQQTTTCNIDGRWSPLPEKCTPVCGQISQGGAYIVGGQTSEITKVPWHAGIYRKYRINYVAEQVCGGSIISAKVIISAMHCFWDPSEDKIHNKEDYHVAVGKSRRQFDEPENFKPQFFTIENIFYDEGYIDYAGYYANDIAVVILDKFIEISSHIAPVCIQFGLKYDDKIVQPGLIGKVAGWGLEQAKGEPSPVLKEIELPVVSKKDCIKHSTMEFRQFITSDKFCAGHLTGIGVCRGDSGGGLVFQQRKGIGSVYFLGGIVSTGANLDGSCDNYKYAAFTNVGYYSDFIEKYYLEYQPNL